MLNELFEYVQNNMDKILTAIANHLTISIISLIIALIIGVSFGILVVKYKKLKKITVGLFSILRIIPSLAILILLIPILGTGVKPAIVALVLLVYHLY